MGKSISLFNDFKKGENTVTNYCGLMLKLIYNESPIAFQMIITDLIADTPFSFDILAEFKQQEAKSLNLPTKKKCVPDLCLRQKSFIIYFENKLTDWHYVEQILGHLEGLDNERNADIKILFLLTKEYESDIDNRIDEGIKKAQERGIALKYVTYQDLLEAIKHAIEENKGSDYLRMFVKEFEDYLTEHDLLPAWKHRLDIVCCGGTRDEVEGDDKYICPDTGGAYSHQRSKYFGAYWGRNVNFVAEIAGLVVVHEEASGNRIYSCKYVNDMSIEPKELEKMAEERFLRCADWRFKEVKSKDLQIFVLQNKRSLDYQKGTKGGLRAKTYHLVNAETIDELCQELNGKKWD